MNGKREHVWKMEMFSIWSRGAMPKHDDWWLIIDYWLFTHYILISGVHQATQVSDYSQAHQDTQVSDYWLGAGLIGTHLVSLIANLYFFFLIVCVFER